LNKLSYAEAREWFWVRTAVWSAAAGVASIIISFFYYESTVNLFQTRLTYGAIVGVASVLLGLMSAKISTQFPWMRLGKKYAWLLNSILCALVAILIAVLICGIILSVMRDNIEQYPTQETIAMAYEIMIFAISLSGFWGLTFGAWFALRRDRYFVEQI
jgi:hypothetical protein